MKIRLLLAFAILSVTGLVAHTQNQPSAEAEALFTKMMGQINPRHAKWVKSTADEVNQQQLSPEEINKKAQAYGVPGSMNGQDIEAIAFLVLMQASKSAQEDLKAIMAKVKSINNQKAQQRALLAKVQQQKSITAIQLDSFRLLQSRTAALKNGQNPDAIKFTRSSSRVTTVSKAELDATVDKAKNDLDSMSEMGEMESLRLQMAMDRMSKMMSTISNLLKKISKTADDITQNLK